METTTTTKFARKCTATGKGINSGYCFRDGEAYFKEEADLIKHLRSLGDESYNEASDEFLLKEAYDQEEYYHTDWEEIDEDDGYYTADGQWIEANTTKHNLMEIISLIQDNEIGAWEHTLQNTSAAIVIEDFAESDENTIKYNGWFDKLKELADRL